MKLECSFDTTVTVLLSRQISICLFAGGSFSGVSTTQKTTIVLSQILWAFGDSFHHTLFQVWVTFLAAIRTYFFSQKLSTWWLFSLLPVFLHAWKFQCMIEKQWKVVRFHFNSFFLNCTAAAHPFLSKDFCHWRLKSHQAKHHFQLGENAFLVCELSVYNFISFSTIGTYCKLCLKDYQKMKFLKD